MSEQYLILHKVRGEPSFDCATNIGDETGDMWITNSGHRAYPVQTWPLDDVLLELGDDMGLIPSVPDDWPDHYSVNDRRTVAATVERVISPHKSTVTITLEDLGL